MKKFGFAVAFVLAALVAWRIWSSGQMAWVCFALIALSLPLAMTAVMMDAGELLLGSLLLGTLTTILTVLPDDPAYVVLSEAQAGLALLLGALVAFGVYLLLHWAGYVSWLGAMFERLLVGPYAQGEDPDADGGAGYSEPDLSVATPKREAELIDFYGGYRGAHFRPDRSAGAYQRGQNVPLAGNMPAERTRR